MPNQREQMAERVGELLARRAELARLDLPLPPREKQELKSLMLRLGWTRQMGRGAVMDRVRMAKAKPSYDPVVAHAAAILDNPMDNTRLSSLQVADMIHKTLGHAGLVQAVVGARHFHPDGARMKSIREGGAEDRSVRFRRPRVPLRYASRLTLSAGKPFTHTTGEAGFTHDYADEGGNKLGVVRVVPRNDGEMLHVDWAGPEGVKPGEVGNTLGASAVKGLRDQLTAMYPGAKFLTGIRAGGVRKANPERTVVGIPGRYDRLPGGKGAGRPDSAFNAEQLRVGITVEMEHTKDAALAKEIAKDHLTETPDYYRKLRRAKLARPRLYAKADSHLKAHPLVEGFPIEHFLRHLANDPKNEDNVRDLALIALTGKGKLDKAPKPGGMLEVLPYLADAMRDQGLESAEWYNLMSAMDKIKGHDWHVGEALRRTAHEVQAQFPRAPGTEPEFLHTPEGIATRIHSGNDQLEQRVKQHAAQLLPHAEGKDIDESLARHAIRANYVWAKKEYPNSSVTESHRKDALGPAPPGNRVQKAARYRRRPLRYADKTPFGYESLWPTEQAFVDSWGPGKRKEHEAETKASVADKPKSFPGVGEIKALSGVGAAAGGEYAASHSTLQKLLGNPIDAMLWVHANGILSAQARWQAHTRAATRAVRIWRKAGRPTDPVEIHKLNLFGQIGADPNNPKRVVKTSDGQMAGAPTYTGDKIGKMIRLFSLAHTLTEFRPELVSGQPFGKTPNFAGSFVDPRSVAADTHVAKATIPGTLHSLLKAVNMSGPGGAAAYSALLNAQNALTLDPYAATTYKTLVSHAAKEEGNDPRETQERMWAGILGVMVAKYMGATPRAASILGKLNHFAVSRGWDVHQVLLDPRVLDDLEELKIPRQRVVDLVGAARKKRLESGPQGRIKGIDPGALEAVAARLPATVPSGAEPIHSELVNPTRREREEEVRRYAHRRNDFIDALRRVRSSNNRALDRVVDVLGLGRVDKQPALHDTPHGSSPGVALAIYSHVAPEKLHGDASKLALAGNMVGVGVFHVRPEGGDHLWRFRQSGSGLDIRAKLDRHGITNRVLVPHKAGFDVMIPDRGRQLARAVKTYAHTFGLQLQGSPGFFKTIGSQDQAQARDTFRNTVVSSERPSRNARFNPEGLSEADLVSLKINDLRKTRAAQANLRRVQHLKPPGELSDKLLALVQKKGPLSRRQALLSGIFLSGRALDVAEKHAHETGKLVVKTGPPNRPQGGSGRHVTTYSLPAAPERMNRL